ncbi:MAG: tetratricopeptide repeat protein, partial [Acidobacteriota bacterium]
MHRPAKPNPSDDLSGASRSRRRIRGRVRQIVAGLGASLLLVLMPLPVQSGMAAEAVAQSPGSAAAEVPEGSADQLLREGMALLRSGDFPAAAQKLRQVLDRDAAHIEAHIQLGNVLRRMQLYDGARAEYERALELGGGRADLYQNLGVVEARSNRFRASALNFEKAIELAPQRANLHHSLGKA